ncbi:MAG: hypothetical protein ACYC96_15150 [Fimbriimonadaceae bacterium]
MDRRLRRRRVLRVVLINLAVLVVGLAAVAFTMKSQGRSELNEQIALARKEGMATTFAELAPNPRVTDADNAAPFYKKAFADARPLREDLLMLIDWRAPPFDRHNPGDRATFTRLYARLKPAIANLVEGAKRPQCDFHFDLNATDPRGAVALGSDISPIVMAIRIQAELLSDEGHPRRGLALMRSIAPAGRHFIDYRLPFVFTILPFWIVSEAVTDFVTETIQKHGKELGVPKAALATLDALGADPDVIKAIVSDNLNATEWLKPIGIKEFIELYKPPGFDHKYGAEISRDSIIPGMVDRWKAIEFRVTREIVAAARKDGDNWASFHADAAAIADAAAAPKDVSHAYARERRTHRVFWIEFLAPLVSGRRVASQAAAIFAAWDVAGKLPGALPLPGLAAHDPLRDGPMKYTHTARGFTVSAVGRSRVWPRTDGRVVPQPDVIFTYPAKR